MKTLYTVVEASFDYNDEVYSCLDAGKPTAAFKKRENADAECEKRTIRWLRECYNLWEYGYDPVVSDMDKLAEVLGVDVSEKTCRGCQAKAKRADKFCSQCGKNRFTDILEGFAL